MSEHIEVRGYDGLLFAGDAEIQPVDLGQYQWAVEFLVPNAQIAQFQMRRGERVSVVVGEGSSRPALIDRFAFEQDSAYSGYGGHGRIHLVGKGAAPEASA